MPSKYTPIIIDYLTITLGVCIYALSLAFCILPYKLASGGAAGIGLLVYYATGIEVQNTYFAINIILLVAAIIELGWKFLAKTIYATLTLTCMIWLSQRIYEWCSSPMLVGDERFMAMILAGLGCGLGLGLCFAAGGSTGGTDIIAAIINKHKNMSIGKVLLMVDLSIITSSYLVFHDIQRVVFGYALMAIITFTIDYVVGRNNQSVEFKIYSRNPNPIAELLIKNGMGVTILNGEGYYTHSERKVIISVVTRGEKLLVQRMIKAIDPYAFVTMGNVSGVWGEGFAKMQTKSKEQEKPSLVLLTSNQAEYDKAHDTLSDTLKGIRTMFNNAPDVAAAVAKLINENSDAKKKIEEYAKEKAAAFAKVISENAQEINGIKVVKFSRDADPAMLREAAAILQKEVENFVFAAAFCHEGKPQLVLMYSNDLVAAGHSAANDIREAARFIQGGGGGQPILATAGGRNADGLQAALDKMVETITA